MSREWTVFSRRQYEKTKSLAQAKKKERQ